MRCAACALCACRGQTARLSTRGPPTANTAANTTAQRYTGLWIALSSAVILINKWILDPQLGGFPFPLALSATHMAFCSLLSAALVRVGAVEAAPMPVGVYVRCAPLAAALHSFAQDSCGVGPPSRPSSAPPSTLVLSPHPSLHRGVLPIGALFAATLAASNAAYLYLSVSFIQMIKVGVHALRRRGCFAPRCRPPPLLPRTATNLCCWTLPAHKTQPTNHPPPRPPCRCWCT
jgi:hypothetical protein